MQGASGIAVLLSLLAGVQVAHATGTTAGTSVSKTATVNYNVGGVAQAPVTSAPTSFVVDNKIDLTVTDEVKRGTVAVPHGWGHAGGWRVAAAAGGANVNLLASSDPADLERLAGMAHLNGIPIRLEAVAAAAEGAERAIAAPA